MDRKEAIRRIKAWNLDSDDMEVLAAVIPELKESEDERIRKGLVKLLTVASEAYLVESTGIKKDSYLAYLEKQKEQKPENDARIYNGSDMNRSYERGYKDGKEASEKEFYVESGYTIDESNAYDRGYEMGLEDAKEQKPAEWSYPYGRNETADRLVSIAECLEMDGDCLFNGYSGTECGKFLRELARKQIGCKPAEWSEEDSDNLERVDNYLWMLDSYIGDDCAMPQGKTDKIRRNIQEVLSPWLKSLPERLNLQPKQEWSEEDEKMIDHLIEALPMWANGRIAMLPSVAEEYTNRLKSLRPSWKPSEEQMKALDKAIPVIQADFGKATAEPLESLLIDLQKL